MRAGARGLHPRVPGDAPLPCGAQAVINVDVAYRLTVAYGCYRMLLTRMGVKVPVVHIITDLS